MLRHRFHVSVLVCAAALAVSGCRPVTRSAAPVARPTPTAVATAASLDAAALWQDVTVDTIGVTDEWTNKVELADIDGDGLVDLLFANGGDYETPGAPAASQVFLNQGSGQQFKEATEQVFGPAKMLARVIKVRDVNADGTADIMVGTTYQTQSRLYLGDGSGGFVDVTATNLPQLNASVGDLEFGDVDGDRDLDLILADWGAGSPMNNGGGRTMLWLNDGSGAFSDATAAQMPDVLVKFSWELELVDVDNDYDLDVLVSCKMCSGSFLFENDGTGTFTDVSAGRLPQFSNNYDFEAMDVNGDAYLDLVTINDGPDFREHLLLNNQQGGFVDATMDLWPFTENRSCDDNMDVFLDIDSDGDADLLIGSLDCSDRVLVNDGSGSLTLLNKSQAVMPGTPGTLGLAVADLNGDHRLDVVQAQGEAASPEKVFFGQSIPPDTAAPVITLVENVDSTAAGQPIEIRARVHDSKSPTMPHDWQSVALVWTAQGETRTAPMQWYGEYLWRAAIDDVPAAGFTYQVCARDAAGNEACAAP